jgi:hypothetical protein
MSLASLALATLLAIPDTTPAAPPDTVRRRPHAIQYSDAYAVRLKVHRIGSYSMLPLFAAEWALGQNLLNDASPPSWLKPTHVGVATGIGALFTVNTVTGLMNLWESRSDPSDRPRRWLHSTTMLASDAGFFWTAAIGGNSRTIDSRNRHRNVALASIGLGTASTVMMWLWKT